MCSMAKCIVLLLLLFQICFASAQRISNTALHRTIHASRYFRFHYENDYFSERDSYYTQGINAEYVHPTVSKFFMSKLLVRSSNETKYGIALAHEGYTPTSISHLGILEGDRPFAGCVFINFFSIASHAQRRARTSSSLSLGGIGPLAGAKEIQEGIHRLINYTLPLGWQNQIQNDVILNYQIEYERSLFSKTDYFLLCAKAGARTGTFNTRLSVSTILMAGVFDDPFIHFSTQKRKSQVFVYAEPVLNLIGHDATLQGGLFNASPYTIMPSQLTRLVFQGNAGIVFTINAIQFEYFQSYITKEFETGDTHAWGGVRIGWCIQP
jgi:lipid A 3-O-deacylase